MHRGGLVESRDCPHAPGCRAAERESQENAGEHDDGLPRTDRRDDEAREQRTEGDGAPRDDETCALYSAEQAIGDEGVAVCADDDVEDRADEVRDSQYEAELDR